MPTRRALLIGINYRGTSSALSGCINDVNNMKKFLCKNGYSADNITVMTDDTATKPTRNNIIKGLLDLLLCGSETLFLHYSGHGSWERDLDGDEEDARDESLCPLDYQTAGMITDDQLRGLLMFGRSSNKLTVVLDCCHSGTGLDLTYTLRSGRIRKQNMSMRRDARYKDTPGQVIMISGCLDKQTSADAYEEGAYQGALTFCLLKALNNNQNYTWGELIIRVRGLLKRNRYKQIANLTSGQALNLNSTCEFGK